MSTCDVAVSAPLAGLYTDAEVAQGSTSLCICVTGSWRPALEARPPFLGASGLAPAACCGCSGFSVGTGICSTLVLVAGVSSE